MLSVLETVVREMTGEGGALLCVGRPYETLSDARRIESLAELTPDESFTGAIWDVVGDTEQTLHHLRARLRPGAGLVLAWGMPKSFVASVKGMWGGPPQAKPSIEAVCCALLRHGFSEPRVHVAQPSRGIVSARMPARYSALDALLRRGPVLVPDAQ